MQVLQHQDERHRARRPENPRDKRREQLLPLALWGERARRVRLLRDRQIEQRGHQRHGLARVHARARERPLERLEPPLRRLVALPAEGLPQQVQHGEERRVLTIRRAAGLEPRVWGAAEVEPA